MPTEASIVRKGERAFDDFAQLWKRRKILCVVVILAALSPTTVAIIRHFLGRSKLERQIIKLEQALTDTKRDRDSKATQLAPFLAIANQRFETAPPDMRLNLLLERIHDLPKTVRETAALLPTKRSLTPEAIARVQQKLDYAVRVPVTVSVFLGDDEAFALAQQIKTLFAGSGFTVKGVNRMVSGSPVAGVVLICRRLPKGPLGDAILQLFVELGSEPIASFNESMQESELSVLVGSK